ncbi:MAG: DUF2148 domain-containing protein [Negativicutes bacterium]|nr:DUF2148 domain-containing protein [Negativicutes bacterium]
MFAKSKDAEERAIDYVVDLMCLAARTAPKGRGVDNLVTMVIKAGAKDQIVAEMRKIAKATGAQFFERDANCVDQAPVLILLGQKVKTMGVTPCGYCGYANCGENLANSGLCAISIGDLGIAIGSAVSVAANHRIDNRIMFTVGKAALNLNIFEDDVKIAYGIPLSASGKSPFYDRA